MPIVANTFVSPEEIAARVGRLQAKYAGHPMISEIVYRIGVDWSDDPAVFVDVKVPSETSTEELLPLADKLREDVWTLMRTDELGLHTYLSFKS
jgi:hypothetical protein